MQISDKMVHSECGIIYERWKMADTLKPIKCPACGNTMEKIFIPSAGINLDICTDGCGGIYFDNREFGMFDESNEDISKILEKVQGKKFAKVNEEMTRVCPNCGAKMVKIIQA